MGRQEVRVRQRGNGDGHRSRCSDQASLHRRQAGAEGPRREAAAPFTTSTLQQQAILRLRFGGDRTMKMAQRLYEGVDLGSEGSVALITYMRTDSTRVSADALQAVRAHIDSKYGSAYLPANPHTYASGKSARRPTRRSARPICPTRRSAWPSLGLQGDQLKLYTLIYQRFVASQMAAADLRRHQRRGSRRRRERQRAGPVGLVQGAGQGAEVRRLSQGAAAGRQARGRHAAAAEPSSRSSIGST